MKKEDKQIFKQYINEYKFDECKVQQYADIEVLSNGYILIRIPNDYTEIEEIIIFDREHKLVSVEFIDWFTGGIIYKKWRRSKSIKRGIDNIIFKVNKFFNQK